MADRICGSIVLAQLHVFFLWGVIIRDLVRSACHSPILKILLQTMVKMSINASHPA